ncbi:protocadherin Fat 4-like isoform X4 [Octopus vulgaris]|uniref:Protocadherin Fat 4-like isoform X4 n=2 Tax=Octopus vulgaris TaxID=6645 RepID=A0AA36AL22_OCTVU|nr:protocadherin Fat 4-like isoform X4 [Octopus vulgaris]
MTQNKNSLSEVNLFMRTMEHSRTKIIFPGFLTGYFMFSVGYVYLCQGTFVNDGNVTSQNKSLVNHSMFDDLSTASFDSEIIISSTHLPGAAVLQSTGRMKKPPLTSTTAATNKGQNVGNSESITTASVSSLSSANPAIIRSPILENVNEAQLKSLSSKDQFSLKKAPVYKIPELPHSHWISGPANHTVIHRVKKDTWPQSLKTCTPPGTPILAIHQSVPEDTPKDSTLPEWSEQLKSLCADNEERIYLILEQAPANPYFGIDKVTGALKVIRNLDEIDSPEDHVLVINVRCGNSITIVLTLSIKRINRYAPVFTQDNYLFITRRNVTVGSFVGQVSAFDQDVGPNGHIHMYRIYGGNDDKKFSINEQGMITTASTSTVFPADRIYTLNIEVKDSGHKPKKGTSKVTVMVSNMMCETPLFNQEFYFFYLSHSPVPADHPLGYIGYEKNGFDSISVDMEKSSVKEFFVFDEPFGKKVLLKSKREISFNEVLTSLSAFLVTHNLLRFSILICSSTSVHCARSSIFLSLEQVNKFGDQTKTVNISENNSPNAVVINTGHFMGKPNSIYRFVEKYPDFNIHPITGVITTNRSFDREAGDRRFIIRVEAISDAEDSCRNIEDRMMVIVNILDENDNNPDFNFVSGKTLNGTVPENSLSGTEVILDTPAHQLEVQDIDAGENGTVTLSLNGATQFRLRKVENSSYVVYVKANWSLDREWRSNYNVSITARDGGDPPRSSVIYLFIKVLDVNDHSPQFQYTSYNMTATENSPLGKVIGYVHADDEDSEVNGEIEYSIVSGSMEMFEIGEKNGSIYISQPKLDREKKDIYHITVRAQDKGFPRKQAHTVVNVYVEDVNDNAPEFSQQAYTVTVPENTPVGDIIFQVDARDRDLGAGGQVSFFLEPRSKFFYIDKNNGSIYLNKSLDYETTRKHFTFNILSHDHGTPSISSIAPIEIKVTDVNDEVPEFSQPLYVSQITKTSPIGKAITVVQAKDTDSEIIYYLTPSSSEFTIDKSGVIVQTENIDKTIFSPGTLYKEFNVVATDSIHTANTSVQIFATEDEPIEFRHPVYRLKIPEDIRPGGRVFRLKMSRNRNSGILSSDPSLANLTYHMMFPLDWFTVNSTTGIITTTSELDREVLTSSYQQFAVEAVDSTGQTVATTAIVVNITDANDNAPRCTFPLYKFTHVEDSFLGSIVGRIHATDEDSGKNARLKFSIIGGNVGNTFKITNNGDLTLNEILDRETVNIYNLTILVQDGGDPQLNGTCSAIVSVEDVNDNDPVFEQPQYNAAVREEAPPYQSVLRVRCLDKDERSNIRYQLLTIDSLFALNAETGVLETIVRLDHETHPGSYQLYAECTDGGDFPRYSSPVILNVTVEDMNDNRPTFINETYHAQLYTNATIGRHIASLSATDKDKGQNGEISYYIIGGDPFEEFELNPKSGLLTTKVSFQDRLSGSRMLFVEAKDGGYPDALSDVAKVHIEVIQLNQHAPKFTLSVFRANVTEEKVIRKFLQLRASDEDPDDKIAYHLLSSSNAESTVNWTDYFSISSSGWISVKNKIDRDTLNISQASLTVYAVDNGLPPKTGSTLLLVNISDINDNIPDFVGYNMTYVIEIPQNTQGNKEWWLPEALDPDEGQNAKVKYSVQFVPNEDPEMTALFDEVFSVSKDLRKLIIKKPLPTSSWRPENFSVALLSYRARNVAPLEKATKQSGRDEIYIRVKMISNNTNFYQPHFIGVTDPLILSISENTSIGANLFQFTAIDGDKGSSENITYSMQTNSAKTKWLFELNKQTGSLQLQNAIQENDIGNYTLWVIASDNDVIPKTKSLFVWIEIIELREVAVTLAPPTLDSYGWSTITIPFPILTGAAAGVLLVVFSLLGLLICQCKRRTQRRPRQMPPEEDQYHEAIHDKHSLPHARRPDLVRATRHDGHESQQLLSPSMRAGAKDNAYTHLRKSTGPMGGVSLPGLGPERHFMDSASPSSNTPSRNTLETDYAIPAIPDPDYEDFPPPPPHLEDPYMMVSTPKLASFRSKV